MGQNAGHVDESFFYLLCRWFPTSTGGPGWNILQSGGNIDQENTRVGSLAKLVHEGIDQADERLLLGLNGIAVCKHQDESAGLAT